MNVNEIEAIRDLQEKIHEGNVNAGWWTDLDSGANLAEEARNRTRLGKAIIAEKLALIHSEVSEALEGARKNLPDDKLPHRPMIEVEMADTVIRILDACGALKLDLAGAIYEKLQFNKQRPDHKIENRMKENGKAY